MLLTRLIALTIVASFLLSAEKRLWADQEPSSEANFSLENLLAEGVELTPEDMIFLQHALSNVEGQLDEELSRLGDLEARLERLEDLEALIDSGDFSEESLRLRLQALARFSKSYQSRSYQRMTFEGDLVWREDPVSVGGFLLSFQDYERFLLATTSSELSDWLTESVAILELSIDEQSQRIADLEAREKEIQLALDVRSKESSFAEERQPSRGYGVRMWLD